MLTHNIDTTPTQSRIKENADVDHYVRLDAACKYANTLMCMHM